MKSKKNRLKEGFTLLEAMIGTGIFAVGALGAFGLMSWIAQATDYSGRLVEASAVGQDQIEALAELGHDAITSGSTNIPPYSMVWTVTSGVGHKTVALDVKWSRLSGQEQKVRLSTVLAEDIVIALVPDNAKPGNGGTAPPTSPTSP